MVRYCVFRLIGRSSPVGVVVRGRSRYGFVEAEERARRQKFEKGLHRHKLCLYGEDELFIRAAAGKLGCTMTHLVRLALELNLRRLEASIGRSRFHELSFYWLGIKRQRVGEFPNSLTNISTLRFRRFPETEYW